ncbi:Rrf2 family transcriptional regulator [Virgibacillus sp. 179-BFC.A HS]|uniref:Rrf2 family transcriptional regulator n=1 Tax=Tigheibacillus jepli TaxID=3035914 RepID=A0ABU5CJD2_9BACI|nr:Rrf2 family transcriptional regulator [Virgibacillus sp. 179-BFC.A HS]MDY0406472.1 Rrf2 family transcriptional regulator [Virgibacillus sp. 179-BFC.A HS]
MKYSKATNYALHIMLDFAVNFPNQRVGVQQLAEQQGLSPTYLSKILMNLVKAGMIESTSGANGGYKLKPEWKNISFLDVIRAIEGTTSLYSGCMNNDPGCLIQKTMFSAEKKMEEELGYQKISEIANRSAGVL